MTSEETTKGIGRIHADSMKAAEEAAPRKQQAKIRAERIRKHISEFFVGPGQLPPRGVSLLSDETSPATKTGVMGNPFGRAGRSLPVPDAAAKTPVEPIVEPIDDACIPDARSPKGSSRLDLLR